MTAKVLSFTLPRGGWGNAELAQFARIQRLLENVGLHITMEHGITDEGDPWCVFCSYTSGDVIIHCARIDGVYMFDSPIIHGPINGRSFDHCAERFLDEAMRAMPATRSHASLQVHPSALLASVFLTIILCAQARTEQGYYQSFGSDGAIDIDGGAAHASGVLKLIAQHLSDLFGQADAGAGVPQNQQLQSWGQIVPIGLSVSVLGLIHELISQEEKLLLALNALPPIVSEFDESENEHVQADAADAAHNPDHDGQSADADAVDGAATGEDAVAEDAEEQDFAASDEDSGLLNMISSGNVDVQAQAASVESLAAALKAIEAGAPVVVHDEDGREVADAEKAVMGSVSSPADAASAADSVTSATIAVLKSAVGADAIEFSQVSIGAAELASLQSVEIDKAAAAPVAANAPVEVESNEPETVIETLVRLIEVAQNVSYVESDTGVFIFDNDAIDVPAEQRYVETFVFEDNSEIMFVGVASDFTDLIA